MKLTQIIIFATWTLRSISNALISKLTCGPLMNTTIHVLWPRLEDQTCSLSSPGCIDANGVLQMQCCEDGQFDGVSCTADSSLKDPRCFDGMLSTIQEKSLSVCYSYVENSFVFDCKSRTGKGMQIDTKLLTEIGGVDNKIWLPIEKFGDAYRYTSRNDLYMEVHSSADTFSDKRFCMILLNNSPEPSYCHDLNLGICLEYPYIIYKFQIEDLQSLLGSVSVFCKQASENQFCSLYELGYHLNVAYFSSRSFFLKHYLFLQKKNLRTILQIRQEDSPSVNGNIYLYAALSADDWNIFTENSVSFTVYESTDEYLFVKPEITVSRNQNSILVIADALQNIKSIETDACTIHCFFNASSTSIFTKFDVNINQLSYFEFNNEDGLVWCDAFDHDLNIIKSNVVDIQTQDDQNGYISEFLITLFEINDCSRETLSVVQNLLNDALKNESDFTVTLLRSCKEKDQMIDVIVEWYPTEPTQSAEEIEDTFLKLEVIIENMLKDKNEEVEDILLKFIGHKNYCLQDTTYFANQSFIWPTTMKEETVSSQPLCYQFDNNNTQVTKRKCANYANETSYWLNIEPCFPVTNITLILQQLSNFEEENFNNTLDDLNILVENSFETFEPFDVFLVSEILSLLSNSQDIYDINLTNLPFIISNLHLVGKEVLEKSQQEYNATDSILHTLTKIYAIHEHEKQFMSDYYSNIPINLVNPDNTTSAASISLQLLCDITSSLVFYNNFFFYSNDYVVLSIFYEDYFFNSATLTIHTESIIFQAVTPDQKDFAPFTVFVRTPQNDSGQFCACWKYASKYNSLKSSEWRTVTMLKDEPHSVCVFKKFQYCAVFNRDSSIDYEYISKLSTKYNQYMNDSVYPPYFISVALSVILDQVILGESDISLEIEKESNSMEFTVNWNLERSQNATVDIDAESERISTLIETITSYSNAVITDIKVDYIRHRTFCTSLVDSGTFLWPITKLGSSTEAVPDCFISKQGKVQILVRKCLGDDQIGAYWENIESCSQAPNVTDSLDYIINNFDYSNANEVLEDLDNMMKISTDYFIPYDVYLLAEIFILLSNATEKTELNLTSLSSVVSGMQMLNQSVVIEAQSTYNATDQILYYLDRILLASSTSESYSFVNSEYYLAGISNCTNFKGIILQYFGNSYNVTTVEGEVDYDELIKDEYFEAAIIFSDILLENIRNVETSSIIISIFFTSVLFNDVNTIRNVTSIFGILISNYDVDTFDGPIELIYKRNVSADDCAYWEYGMKNGNPIYGAWKDESNSFIKKIFLTCQFNHTTHFAMLIADVEDDKIILDFITNIGCSLSLVGLSGILITGLIFERWRKNIGNIILLNFVLTIIIQIGLFYLSSFVHIPFPNTDVCILTGALLHYFVISEFCWMLIIAVLQFKRFVQVLTGPPKYLLLKSLFVGWILPLIPVLSILAIDPNNYTSGLTGLCYPSNLGLYLGVWLPIFLIILINFIIFSYIMYSIFHRKTECVDTVTNEVIFQWRLAFLLFFMLGLTWSFAFLGQFLLPELFLSLFCILATLQGFVMFLFFIVFDKRTRLMYTSMFKKLLKKYTF